MFLSYFIVRWRTLGDVRLALELLRVLNAGDAGSDDASDKGGDDVGSDQRVAAGSDDASDKGGDDVGSEQRVAVWREYRAMLPPSTGAAAGAYTRPLLSST